MPNKFERSAGLSVLEAFLDLFPCNEIVALGNVAASQLKELNVETHQVRHPASGGAKLFRQQIAKIVNKFTWRCRSRRRGLDGRANVI